MNLLTSHDSDLASEISSHTLLQESPTTIQSTPLPDNGSDDNGSDDNGSDDNGSDDPCDTNIEHISCPVCKEITINPRLYPCGHNVCEECMIASDKATQEDLVNSVPIYKCPLCRQETMTQWYDRPVNNALIDIFCKLSDAYKRKNDQHSRKRQTDLPQFIPKNINLAFLSSKMRQHKADVLYKQLLPILYTAALNGKSYITIACTSSDIYIVADLIAKRLIDENGIYRFVAGQRECQIELVPSDRSYRYEYTNEHYDTNRPILSANSLTESTDNQNSNNAQATDSEDLVPVNVHFSQTTLSPASELRSHELGEFLTNHIARNLTQHF